MVHTGPWLGEKETNFPVRIRFGFHYRVDLQHRIIPEGYALLDIPGAFIQMGIDLFDRLKPEFAVENHFEKRIKIKHITMTFSTDFT